MKSENTPSATAGKPSDQRIDQRAADIAAANRLVNEALWLVFAERRAETLQ